jgi:DNA polymerase (family X)
MTNRDIATMFEEVADLLEFQDANPFRVRAYRNAARRISDFPEPLEQIVNDRQRSLTDIEGIGKDLALKIEELVKTRKLAMLDELRALVPPGVMALLRIPSLGPKKAATLHKELGIVSLEMLRAAKSASSRASARRRRKRFLRASTSPPRPTCGCTGPKPTRSSSSS